MDFSKVCVALSAFRKTILALAGLHKKTGWLSVVAERELRLEWRAWLKIREINALVSL